MRYLLILTVATIITILYGCNDSTKPSNTKILDSVVVVTDTIMPDIHCLEYNSGDSIYIIKTEIEYKQLIDIKSNIIPCDTYRFPKIDFNKYTLLGRMIVGGGLPPGPEFIRTVTRYNNEMKYVYHIKLIEYNYKEIETGHPIFSFNWILVPNIPSDFSIQIDTTYINNIVN